MSNKSEIKINGVEIHKGNDLSKEEWDETATIMLRMMKGPSGPVTSLAPLLKNPDMDYWQRSENKTLESNPEFENTWEEAADDRS